MKTSLLTLYYDNYNSLAELVLPNWMEYCKRHGYDLITHVGDYGYSHDIPIGFHKIKLLYDVLFASLNPPDVVWCLDLDVLITNQDISIDTFVCQHPNKSYFVCNDVNGLNNGSFIVRRNNATKEILEFMLRNEERRQNEQDTLKFNWRSRTFASHIQILEHPAINSLRYDLYAEHRHHAAARLDQWKPDHFVLHLPGMNLNRRLDIFSKILLELKV